MMTPRTTKQKTEIKEYLMSREDHPTAEMVYAALKPKLPKISLGTVYRNLNSMADNGEIIRLRLSDGLVHFDGKTEDHYHFICNNCGQVRDVFGVEGVLNIDNDSFPGQLDGQLTYFYGKCADCLE